MPNPLCIAIDIHEYFMPAHCDLCTNMNYKGELLCDVRVQQFNTQELRGSTQIRIRHWVQISAWAQFTGIMQDDVV